MPPLIFRFILLIVFGSLIWLILAVRLGSVVPEDFVNSAIPLPELNAESWHIYSPVEWRRLALRQAEAGNLNSAEQALQQSLILNPAAALSAAPLAQIYRQQGKTEQAQWWFKQGQRLWPAKFYQLQKKHVQQQAARQLEARTKQLQTTIPDKTKRREAIKSLQQAHKKRLKTYLDKLLEDTLNAQKPR